MNIPNSQPAKLSGILAIHTADPARILGRKSRTRSAKARPRIIQDHAPSRIKGFRLEAIDSRREAMGFRREAMESGREAMGSRRSADGGAEMPVILSSSSGFRAMSTLDHEQGTTKVVESMNTFHLSRSAVSVLLVLFWLSQAAKAQQRELRREVSCDNGMIFRLWDVTNPNPSTEPSSQGPGLPLIQVPGRPLIHEELTLSLPGEEGRYWLFYQGDPEPSDEFMVKMDGFRGIRDVLVVGTRAELIVIDNVVDWTLMRLRLADGVWLYDGQVSIGGSHGLGLPKLTALGVIEVPGRIFRVADDGVVTKNGELYKSPNFTPPEGFDFVAEYRRQYLYSKNYYKLKSEPKGVPKWVKLATDKPAAAVPAKSPKTTGEPSTNSKASPDGIGPEKQKR